jgi:hypothetical protein
LALSIPQDAPLGERLVWLRDHRGALAPIAFYVSDHPSAERLDVPVQDVSLPVAIDGNMDEGAVHRFRFEADARPISAEALALRLGPYDADLRLRIRNAAGELVASADLSPLGRLDPMLTFQPPTPGAYTLEVDEATQRGGAARPYRIHIGEFVRPTVVLPLGVERNSQVTLRYQDPGFPLSETLSVPVDVIGLFHHFPKDPTGVFTSTPIPLWVVDAPSAIFENDRKTTAPIPGVWNGVLSNEIQSHTWPLELESGVALTLTVRARSLGSSLDPAIEVRDPTGAVLASADDTAGSMDPSLRLRTRRKGLHQLIVRDTSRKLMTPGAYCITVDKDIERVPTSIDTGRPQIPAIVAVPRGGRGAIRMVLPDATTPLQSFLDLPPSVRVLSFAPDQGTSRMAVVFEADADAPLSSALVRPCDAESQRPTDFLQSVPLVVVENDRVYWNSNLHALPLVVTERLPYGIDVEPLSVPLIRNSDGHMRVRIRRDEGFANSIQLRLLNPPPGVRASTVTVDRSREFVDIPISHAGVLPKVAWTTVVVAQCTIDGRSTETASAPVDLPIESGSLGAPAISFRLEAGQTSTWPIRLEHRSPFRGEARVELRGLPSGVSAKALPITPGLVDYSIELTVAADAPAAYVKSIVLRVHLPMGAGVAIQDMRMGPLRVLSAQGDKTEKAGKEPPEPRGTLENPKT